MSENLGTTSPDKVCAGCGKPTAVWWGKTCPKCGAPNPEYPAQHQGTPTEKENSSTLSTLSGCLAATLAIVFVISILVGVVNWAWDGIASMFKPSPRPVFTGVMDIKGIRLGLTETEVQRLVQGLQYTGFRQEQSANFTKLACEDKFSKPDNKCGFTIANKQIESADFYFLNGSLGGALIYFDDDLFEIVWTGLVEKYGKPYLIEETSLKNRFGVSSEHVKVTWTNNNEHVLLLQNHKVEGNSYQPSGILYLTDRSFERAIEADSAAHGKKPDKKDL